MGRYIIKINTCSESSRKEINAACIEKRKNTRIPVCVPISCVSVDPNSKPLDYNMGIIRDISQAGVGIEASKDVSSDRLILTFVDLDHKIVEIEGKVVFSKQNSSGTFQIGVLLQGSRLDIIEYVKKLVRFYHHTRKQDPSSKN